MQADRQHKGAPNPQGGLSSRCLKVNSLKVIVMRNKLLSVPWHHVNPTIPVVVSVVSGSKIIAVSSCLDGAHSLNGAHSQTDTHTGSLDPESWLAKALTYLIPHI